MRDLELPAGIFPERTYAAQVMGDSMTGDHIEDGDYVVVDPYQAARDGDIAVVMVSNWRDPSGRVVKKGRLVKRLRRGGTVLETGRNCGRSHGVVG